MNLWEFFLFFCSPPQDCETWFLKRGLQSCPQVLPNQALRVPSPPPCHPLLTCTRLHSAWMALPAFPSFSWEMPVCPPLWTSSLFLHFWTPQDFMQISIHMQHTVVSLCVPIHLFILSQYFLSTNNALDTALGTQQGARLSSCFHRAED